MREVYCAKPRGSAEVSDRVSNNEITRFKKEKTSRTGFEPVISALRGRRPGPLDERDIY